MKLKVGDKVLVMHGCSFEDKQNAIQARWERQMNSFIGRQTKIIEEHNSFPNWFKLDKCDGWYLHKNWLAPIKKEKLTYKRFFQNETN